MDFELQFLTRGKALCGKTFPHFANTWNRVVHAVTNLKGDADVDAAQGRIKVDFADPDHPVIRCVNCKGGGGGSSAGGGSALPGAFELVQTLDDAGTSVTAREVRNLYANFGGVTRQCSAASTTVATGDGVVYASFDISAGNDGSVTLGLAESVSAVIEMQSDLSRYVVPLYVCTGVEVVDLRNAPQVQIFESI